MASTLSITFILLSLLRLSYSIPSETILDAAEILTDSGFLSMALTIEIASLSLPQSPSLTIFAPPDTAFAQSGQPPLALLQYHLLPLAFSLQSLKSLPSGAKITTMLPGHSLTVTTTPLDHQTSLNNVTVNESPIFDDGSLIIFGIEKFFDPHFDNSSPIRRNRPNMECLALMNNDTLDFLGDYSFDNAVGELRARGHSVMATFLNMQFLGFQNRPMLTIFAPTDTALMSRISNFSEWPSILHRHVVPCRLLWNDLVDLDDRTELKTYLEGFTINVTRSNGILMLNNVAVNFPDMYYSDWVIVHGLQHLLEAPKRFDEMSELESPSEAPTDLPHNDEESTISHNHFSVYRS